jgi:nicotinate-nucleotide adenylyltransferase
VGVARACLGIFGGTFDPPHYGHLAAAQEIGYALELDRVLLVPAQQNPLKAGGPGASAEQRVRMLELALADDPRLVVSRLDVDRPPPSYTVDLLAALQDLYPDSELLFLVGADALRELPAWRQPGEILRRWRLVTFTRAGFPPPDLSELENHLPGAAQRIEVREVPGVAVSSRDLRARVANGHPIRYLLPESVRHYVEQEGLYLSSPLRES